MKTLIHPSYFPNIATFAVLVQKSVVWEACDNFQKQTYRNRCYICKDQGKHMLNIPIKHVGGDQGRQKYRTVEVDNTVNWQKNHWRTLETAYRTSPFFEFYEDELQPLFEERTHSLFDFNLKAIDAVAGCLGIPVSKDLSQVFEPRPEQLVDGRILVDAKRPPKISMPAYTQVFAERHGFISNLSILDLLFNEGTNAVTYLKNVPLAFLDA